MSLTPEQEADFLKEQVTNRVQGWGCLGIVVFVGYAICACVSGGYGALDDSGWILHRVETTISARNDWLTGESKDCFSYPLRYREARPLGKDSGYALADVFCDDGPDYKMTLTFYGREAQPEYQIIGWRCTKKDESFVCYQTQGYR